MEFECIITVEKFVENFIICLFLRDFYNMFISDEDGFKVFVLLFLKMSRFSMFMLSFSYFAYQGFFSETSCLSQPFHPLPVIRMFDNEPVAILQTGIA